MPKRLKPNASSSCGAVSQFHPTIPSPSTTPFLTTDTDLPMMPSPPTSRSKRLSSASPSAFATTSTTENNTFPAVSTPPVRSPRLLSALVSRGGRSNTGLATDWIRISQSGSASVDDSSVGSELGTGLRKCSWQPAKPVPPVGRRFATVRKNEPRQHPSTRPGGKERRGNQSAPAPPREVLVENPLHISLELSFWVRCLRNRYRRDKNRSGAEQSLDPSHGLCCPVCPLAIYTELDAKTRAHSRKGGRERACFPLAAHVVRISSSASFPRPFVALSEFFFFFLFSFVRWFLFSVRFRGSVGNGTCVFFFCFFLFEIDSDLLGSELRSCALAAGTLTHRAPRASRGQDKTRAVNRLVWEKKERKKVVDSVREKNKTTRTTETKRLG